MNGWVLKPSCGARNEKVGNIQDLNLALFFTTNKATPSPAEHMAADPSSRSVAL